MNIDAQLVIQNLAEKLAQAEVENATLKAAMKQLQDSSATEGADNTATEPQTVPAEGTVQ